MFIIPLIIIVLLVYLFLSCVRVVPQASAYVVERLGAYQSTWSVGLHFKMPFIERIARKVNLKEQVVDFAPQPVITKDNVIVINISSIIIYWVYIIFCSW